MRTVAELRQALDPFRLRLFGMARRMTIKLTSRALWQLVGFRLPSGASSADETINAEPFTGIGFYARPPASGKPEAIVIMVGADATHPVVVAVRDEATRAAIAGTLKVDETMLFNSKAFFHIKDDATAHITKPGTTTEKMIKGETYRAAEDTLVTAMSVFAAAISTFAATCVGPTAPQLTALTGAATTFEGAVTAFKAAAATYLASVGRVG